MSYRVAYLGDRARREYLATGAISLDDASWHVRRLKRRGMTAWVEDTRGRFVPIKGTSRQPGFNP